MWWAGEFYAEWAGDLPELRAMNFMNTNKPFGDPVKVIGQVPAPIPVIGHYGVTLPSSPLRPRLSVPAAGVRINLELLVADLAA